MPGVDGNSVWLPIDSKFPGDTYAHLQDAQASGDAQAVENARHALELVLRSEAKDIREKYVEPPYTTAFGILFLPFEGLYAEVVNAGLLEVLQRDYQVNVAGPSTMAALLNSLQMGFKTLAILKLSGASAVMLALAACDDSCSSGSTSSGSATETPPSPPIPVIRDGQKILTIFNAELARRKVENIKFEYSKGLEHAIQADVQMFVDNGSPEFPSDEGLRLRMEGVTVAASIGEDPACVYKTLVTQGSSKNYFVFVIPVAAELDLKAAARSVGEKSVAMIHVADINKVTGYVRGGCSPVGMKKQYRTVFDESVLTQQKVYVSGGRIGTQVCCAPADLIRAARAATAKIIF